MNNQTNVAASRGWKRLLILSLWLIPLLPLLGCGASAHNKMSTPSAARYGAEESPMASPPPGEPALTVATEDGEDLYDESPGGDEAQAQPVSPAPAAAPAMRTDSAVTGGEKRVKLAENQARPKAQTDPHRAAPREASDAVTIQQVLIYTADFRMAVFEVDKSMDKIEALARSLGGFLARRSSHESVIRVPASKFRQAVKGTLDLGDVLERDVRVEDVTEQMTDLLLRLRNARQVRDRIAQLLAKSHNVKDSLRIERELARISEQIERMEGRLKLLRNKARYSTITIRFQQKGPANGHAGGSFHLPFGWLSNLGLGRLMNLNY